MPKFNAFSRFHLLYYSASGLAFLWWTVTLQLHRGDPEGVFAGFAPLWNWTNDPVLQFLIQAGLVVLGLFLAPGGIIVGLCLMVCSVVLVCGIGLLAAIVYGLVTLASLSITGFILSFVITIGIVLALFKTFTSWGRKRNLKRQRIESTSGYSPAGPSMAGTGFSGNPAASDSGVWGVADEMARIFVPESSDHKAERHERAYTAGAEAAQKAGLVEDVFNGFGEIVSDMVPGETTEHKSERAGYSDTKEGKTK